MSSERAEKERRKNKKMIGQQWKVQMLKWYEEQINKNEDVTQTFSNKAEEILANLDTNKSIKSGTLEKWMRDFRRHHNIELPRKIKKDSFTTRIRKQWNEELLECYKKQINEKKAEIGQIICKEAEQILKNIDINKCIQLNTLNNWLPEFAKNHNIQLPYRIEQKHSQLEELLFNWLLEKMLKKKRISSISTERLQKKTTKLIRDKCNNDGPSNISVWLNSFINCHEILTKPDIIKNFIQEGDKTNQSDKNVDKQLFYWLRKQKESGNTISLKMLVDKTMELLEAFDEPEKSWPWKIKHHLVRRDYFFTPETSSKASSETSPNRAHKSDETDQAGTSKLMKRKIEENAAEEIPSNPTKKFKRKKKEGTSYEMSPNRAQKSDETNQAIAETLKSTKNVIEEDAASEEIPSSLTKKYTTEEKEIPPEMLRTKKYEFKGKFIKLNEQLFNSLLDWITSNKEQIIKKETSKMSKKLRKTLENKFTELIPTCGGPKGHSKEFWLNNFMKFHEILTKLDNLKDLIQRRDETSQSENLDKQLFYWLLKQKELGKTILFNLLIEKIMELLEAFGGSEEIKKESWPWKILDHYVELDSYTPKTSSETSPNRAHKSDETDQAGTFKSMKRKIEENAAEEIPSNPTKKFKKKEKGGTLYEMSPDRAQKSDETNQAIAETPKPIENVIEENLIYEDIFPEPPSPMSNKSEEREAIPFQISANETSLEDILTGNEDTSLEDIESIYKNYEPLPDTVQEHQE